ncbi:MAG TPA: nucleoside-diphosphate kinase [Candidatus Babeliales bacterium]|nr:nucleoside-diphosphate kinase [Candidatus Babeliales bacterium]
MIEQTLAIIKPDAVAALFSGAIIELIERNGFVIKRMEKRHIALDTAKKFYHVHKDRSFYNELVEFIISGPSIVMVLERENAINCWRELMGTTDPAKAAMGTIRRMFGKSIGPNASHGSDASDTAAYEINVMFGS